MASELCPFAIQILDIPHAIHWAMLCGKALLGEGDAGLPLWETRIRQLIDDDSPDAAIAELLDCLPLTSTDDQLAALDDVIGYYRNNDKRMRYRTFRSLGLPVGSGIVESAAPARPPGPNEARWPALEHRPRTTNDPASRHLPHCRRPSLSLGHPRSSQGSPAPISPTAAQRSTPRQAPLHPAHGQPPQPGPRSRLKVIVHPLIIGTTRNTVRHGTK